jgi:hypothetical protein
MEPATNNTTGDHFSLERALVSARRSVVFGQIKPDELEPWGLALSGGGIRSATFALGVAQAMAKAQVQGRTLWSRFDFLSTVSGGGYIGGFLTSLFIPGRLQPNTDAREAARQALQALSNDPPGRSDHHKVQQTPVDRPLAWLRENGRYLAPEGAGDYFFAVAVGLRNFLAVQYVLATALFSLAMVSQSLGKLSKSIIEGLLPAEASSTLNSWLSFNTLSPWVLVGVFLLIAWVAPLGMAYWMTQPNHQKSLKSSPKAISSASLVYLVVGGISMFAAQRLLAVSQHSFAITLAMIGVWCLMAFALHGAAVVFEKALKDTVLSVRSTITRWYVHLLQWVLWMLALGTLESIAQWLYTQSGGSGNIMSGAFWSVALSSGLVWLVNVVSGKKDTSAVGRLANKLPTQWLVNGVAAIVALALITGWLFLAVVIREKFNSGPAFWYVTLAVLLLACITGQFPGFINLSSWHAFYSSRLKRAYLGATNHQRSDPQHAGVTESVKDDEPDPATYWGIGKAQTTGAPLHLINVCVSKTTGSGGNLTQRDRRGENLCVGPVAYQLGDRICLRPEAKSSSDQATKPSTREALRQRLFQWISPDISPTLQVSEWLGVSGAAVSSGMGRATSLGGAILVGLANVRLGRWWPHPFREQKVEPTKAEKASRGQVFGRVLHALSGTLTTLFKTQVHLFYELMAKFYGTDKDWVYLSDGGNFENTGAYELLRPKRGLGLVVVCDSGCDPDYRFEDLANLIRLARIDHRLELTLDDKALQHPVMSKWLATPQTLGPIHDANAAVGKLPDNRCALLFKVTDPVQGNTVAHALVIKPRVIAACTEDVHQYHAVNPRFPQQNTSDQSFNEEQWESYRKLGLTLGEQLFGSGPISGAFLAALMEHLQDHKGASPSVTGA